MHCNIIFKGKSKFVSLWYFYKSEYCDEIIPKPLCNKTEVCGPLQGRDHRNFKIEIGKLIQILSMSSDKCGGWNSGSNGQQIPMCV